MILSHPHPKHGEVMRVTLCPPLFRTCAEVVIVISLAPTVDALGQPELRAGMSVAARNWRFGLKDPPPEKVCSSPHSPKPRCILFHLRGHKT